MTAISFWLARGESAPPGMTRSRENEKRQHDVATAHFASVWRFLRTLGVPSRAVDDAAQEVFLVVARKLESIRPGSEKGFLFSTAVHVSREIRRKHAREELTADPEESAPEPALLSTVTPEDSFSQKEERDLLLELLDGLSDELRTAFVLYEIEGQSLAEIATMLDVPVGTVSSRLRRGRERFEERLKKLQLRMRGGQ